MPTPIDYTTFIHPHDKAALAALKKIPFFDTVVKLWMKAYTERVQHAVNMASNLRLGPDQLPEIYSSLMDICAKLGIEVPELYVTMAREPNAWTFGDTKPFITLTSGLLEMMSEREIYATMAHECGHILCHHTLYHMVAEWLKDLGDGFLGLGVAAGPLKLAFQYWSRMSEFSADRVEVYCLGETDTFIRESLRFVGGATMPMEKLNVDAFLRQAMDYAEALKESTYEKALQGVYLLQQSHPFMTVRCLEVRKWFDSERNQLPLQANAAETLSW